MSRGAGRGGQKIVWCTLLFFGWLVLMYLLLSSLDPSVVCSNSSPC